MSKKTIPLCILVLLASAIAPRASFADTVTLTVEPSSSSPYTFDIGTSPTFTLLTCLNDQRKINVGESWTAKATNLEDLISKSATNPTDGTLNIAELKEDAYLFTQYLPNPTTQDQITYNQEVQDAIWTILDGTLTTGNYNTDKNNWTEVADLNTYVYSGLTGGLSGTQEVQVQNLVSLAQTTSESSTFYSEFTFYAPTYWGHSGQDDKSGTIPQEFLGYAAVTPEPSSLVLLGTGMAGLADALRRRIKASKQA